MYDNNAKAYFAQLFEHKQGIETELGQQLTWAETPNKKQSKVYLRKSADLTDRDQWPEYQKWLLQNLERFHVIFSKHIKEWAIPEVAGNGALMLNVDG
jgi:hypothetical protein